MRKSIQQYTLNTAVMLLGLVLSGCDVITDCLDDDGPELSPGTLPNPTLNQEYNQVVQVRIRNEPFDDSFNYEFTLSGSIPEGLQTTSTGRDFNIFGTATELGDFDFSVAVEVVERSISSNQTAGLCFTHDTINYQWNVQMM